MISYKIVNYEFEEVEKDSKLYYCIATVHKYRFGFLVDIYCDYLNSKYLLRHEKPNFYNREIKATQTKEIFKQIIHLRTNIFKHG